LNKSNIIEWIDNPATLDEDATRELRDIIQEFPASPILHWLYLKGLQNQKSYLFNSALSRAAIGSPNRSQLLDWVGLEQSETENSKKQRFEFVIPEIEKEPEVEVKQEVKVTPIDAEENKAEPKAELPKPPLPRAKKKEPAELPDDIKALLEKSKPIRSGYHQEHPSEAEETPVSIDLETNEKAKPVEPIAEQPEVKIEEVKEEPIITEVQDEVFSESIAITTEQTVDKEIEEIPFSIEEPLVEQKETYFSIDLDVGIGIGQELVNEVEKLSEPVEVENSFSIELEDYSTAGEELEIEEPKPTAILQNGGADFTSWLKTLKSDEPKQEEITATEPSVLTEEVSFELETDVVPSGPQKVNPIKEKKIELIDKFLEERPKINPRKENFSLLNIAENNESNDNQFVTETLAKVYLAQGHLNKAIEAYEILGLKYPEKNTFFADRIRDIKRRK
jgi:hypothetical protein